MRENLNKILSYIIIIIGILGVLNFAFLMMINAVINLGIILPLFVGSIFLVWGIIRISGKSHIFTIKNTILRRAITFIITLFVVSFVLIQGLILFSAKTDKFSQLDYVVILGAGLKGELITPTLQYRLDKGIEYLIENPELMVVVTGGQGPGETITEALAMERYLVKNGIDISRIIKEDRATSTSENFKFSKEILNQINDKDTYRILIVTNNFHMFRSKMIAKRNGFIVYGAPARTNPYILLNCHIREYFAVIKSVIFD
ncbi:UNVERIFIED_CONTAM: uncharacterized SAM-binding protein YcdF (DUF218 family) [Acetivibrio alkalicellulosi]